MSVFGTLVPRLFAQPTGVEGVQRWYAQGSAGGDSSGGLLALTCTLDLPRKFWALQTVTSMAKGNDPGSVAVYVTGDELNAWVDGGATQQVQAGGTVGYFARLNSRWDIGYDQNAATVTVYVPNNAALTEFSVTLRGHVSNYGMFGLEGLTG